jgi:NAD(P)H-hydrate epimerase
MAGAVAMAGMAALRGGAGLVRLAVPEACLESVASFEASYMTIALPSDQRGRILLRARDTLAPLLHSATAVACGPGLGRAVGTQALVCWLYTTLSKPMVVDADALNALAARADVLARPAGPRILTPHLGEFARLIGVDRVAPEAGRQAADHLAERCRVVVVLKGHRTWITDGRRSAINHTGNPGMATGGSGDVLTGLLTALVCQGLTPFDAARLAVYLHGLAGDAAAEQMGQEAMIASDLIRFLPEAFRRYRANRQVTSGAC